MKLYLDRYALRNPEGEIVEHDWYATADRVALAIAANEPLNMRGYWAKRFYDAIKTMDFLPGGRILAGAGSGHQVTFGNCFVVDYPQDSCDGIVETLRQMIQIMRRGGGVGINISSIRPRGAYIKTVNGHASGPVNWSELFSIATGRVISQGGSRRGALMLLLDCSHPDIMEFVTQKRDHPGSLESANLSVAISDEFMSAVKKDHEWFLQWDHRVYKTIRARELWDLIARSAWESGEPGILFLDRYNAQSNTRYFEDLICVNPCGEQGLPRWGACNLGSLNLANFVEMDGETDWFGLQDTIEAAVRLLDNVIDLNYSFNADMDEAQKKSRRIGLGTMGLAHYLVKKRLRYGSPESLDEIDELYTFIRECAYTVSSNLAREKGSFPAYDRDRFLERPFVERLCDETRALISEQGIRNAVLLTQAPTGTISMLAGTSSGIEPIFALSYKRTDRTGEHILYDPLYREWLEEDDRAGLPPEAAPEWFVTAHQVTPEEHVRVQGKIQEHTDSSISKTINLPNSATVQDVERAYEMAYDLGCKGITVFRDGSREGVLTPLDQAQVQRAGLNPYLTLGEAVALGAGAPTAERWELVKLFALALGLPSLEIFDPGELEVSSPAPQDDEPPYEACPQCGKMSLVSQSHCQQCIDPECGWSACKL